jgi:hypothetical protein
MATQGPPCSSSPSWCSRPALGACSDVRSNVRPLPVGRPFPARLPAATGPGIGRVAVR